MLYRHNHPLTITSHQSPPTIFYYTLHATHDRYFPSYTLGAMMAAQLFETAEKAIPDLRNKIAKGSLMLPFIDIFALSSFL